MKVRSMLRGAGALAVLAAGSAMAVDPVITFDFEDSPAAIDWQPGFATTTSNFTLNGVGRCDNVKRPVGASEWEGSFGFLYGSGATPGPATLTVHDNTQAIDRWFVVKSVNLSSSYTGPFTTLTGYQEGNLMWQIEAKQGLMTSNSPTSAIWPVYTNGHPDVTGNMNVAVDQLVWEAPGGAWSERLDSLVLQPVEAVPTQETIYQWNWGGYWTPHGLFSWTLGPKGMDFLNFDQYWWSGDDITNSPSVIKHRPGMADLPTDGGFDGIPGDTNVGGFGFRGLWVTNQVRTLVSNETLKVSFDWKMYVNGSEDARFLDMFFSTVGDQSAKYMGTLGSELGFVLHQNAASNDVAITFSASDPWMTLEPPQLRIPLTGLGIDVGTADHEGDWLSITYTARKTSVANNWLCGITISNKTTAASYSVGNVTVVNAAAYTSPTYFCVATDDDLSNGDVTSGANTAGYDIDALNVILLMNQPPAPEGYSAFATTYGMDGLPNSAEFEDFDADGILNIYEYGWGGDPTNAADLGTLPSMVTSNGVAYYTGVQLKDPLSGITYKVLATPDLANVAWSTPVWDSSSTVSKDTFFNEVMHGLNLTSEQFFKTVIVTNSP